MAVRDIVQAAAGVGGAEYQISRSLRFNSADSAYLSRTPASAGNRKTWTWSGWVKRSNLNSGELNYLFMAGVSGNETVLAFSSNDANVGADDSLSLYTYVSGFVWIKTTAQLFRDPSSWYHIVAVLDTDNATAEDRARLYVNGVRVDTWEKNTAPSSGYASSRVNDTTEHDIGKANFANRRYNGLMTEIHFVDGQALTPSDFGETDATTGVWKPKAYAGTYGTNGFYLDFSDNSSTTALGYDAAGSNDWTPNNFSVTAGAGNDSLVDTPTNYGVDTGAGGEVRGNYCTWNPLALDSAVTLSNGNLNTSATYRGNQAANFLLTSGKWYWEGSIISGDGYIGSIVDSSYTLNADVSVSSAGSKAVGYWSGTGELFDENGSNQTGGATYTTGDIIGVALDMDSGNVKFYKNNVLQYTYTFGSGSNLTFANGAFPNYNHGQLSGTRTAEFNFGQRPFAYTAPSGFKALCTQNLPTPTVVQGGDYFNTVLYTGNGSTQSITGVGFQPDLVWLKNRADATWWHNLYDAIRGVGNRLASNDTAAEAFSSTSLTSFDSDGFSVGSDNTPNDSGDAYAAWNWNAGGSNATNTDGTITSTVRANPTAGFSIVSYTGTGSNSSQTVGTGLSQPLDFVILKARQTGGGTDSWLVYTSAILLDQNDCLLLNSTSATITNADQGTPNRAATAGQLQLLAGTSASALQNVNASGIDYIAYCFAEVEGFSKFGSYTTNGLNDNVFVYCGFRPRWIMWKRTNGVNAWGIVDTARGTTNVIGPYLLANASDAEASATLVDILSNGFKLRTSGFGNGEVYIFMAFAENPFKYSLAR